MPPRPGHLPGAWLAFLGSVGLLGVLVALLAWDPSAWFGPHPDTRPLVLYCAAGIKAPVEAAARAYEERYGARVQIQYGGSNTLLATIQVGQRGDLYLPADDSYIRTAREQGLLAEVLPLARMRPVLAVRKGNPKRVRSLDDLLKRDLRVAQANPEAAAIGHLARAVFTAAGKWDAFRRRVVVTKPTVNDVAADVALGAVDAGVVWDSTIPQVQGLEVVPVPLFARAHADLSIAVLARCDQPADALRFARFLAARDAGLPLFKEFGFEPAEGDRWAEEPELHLLAGAMLRPAVEETIAEFEEREGVQVTRVYNGCGILVAQMKAGRRSPDAYFACDREFLDMVRDRFGPPVTVSTNQLVLLVHKGNPHHIRGLRDLARPGLRVGVGHEKQCAMGVLTQRTLRQDRSDRAVMKNVKVQSPTGDMLVNQLLTGSLDAAIAYISNAAGQQDRLEAIPIDIPCAFAEQPLAVARDSEHKRLAGRLVDALRAGASRERFEAYGFRWGGRAAGQTR